MSSTAQNGPTIVKNASRAVDWYQTDQDLTGFWTNNGEGDIEAADWTTDGDDAVSFDITVKNGAVQGVVVSNRFCKYSPYNTLQVTGEARGDRIKATLWDYVGGQKSGFAKIEMRIDRKKGLTTVATDEQAPELLPKSFTIGKWETKRPLVKSDFCAAFLKRVFPKH